MTGGDLLAGLIQASPFYVLVAFVAVRSRTLAREGRPVPAYRLGLIAAGVAVGVAADLPPIGTASEERLSVHMLQHMLIGDLAAFLIVIGHDRPAAAAGPHQARRPAAALARAPARGRAAVDHGLLRLAPARALPGRTALQRRPRDRARDDVRRGPRALDGPARPAAQARLVRQRGRARVRDRRALRRHRDRQRLPVVELAVLPRLRRRSRERTGSTPPRTRAWPARSGWSRARW